MTPPTDDTDFRLPRDVVPTRYELTIAPDLEEARFTGHERVDLEVTVPTSTIVCNAAELEISGATLSWPGGSPPPVRLQVSLDEERERVVFTAPRPVLPGPCVLECEFSGVLNDKLRGFYRSTFRDAEGAERVLAVTQFQSTDARRAFPCWDEPDRKAVFSVSLEVAADLLAISNAAERSRTDLGGGRCRIRFADTIPMSSYLVAFVVGPLVASEPVDVDGVALRTVHVAGKEHLSGFALEAAAHALRFFTDYFAQPYPGDKLDLVAIPDFAMGAMENLGCITFREVELLTDQERSARPELERLASVVEHEIAHMWFGDLVTMSWWNGVWLNESFATYMSLCCLDDFKPEYQCWVGFSRDREMALALDGLHTTRPIEFPVRTPGEVESMFDPLTYEKGASLLRMIEQYLGAETFRDGVRNYLAAHRYANTEAADLWSAIEASAHGEPVSELMDSWLLQGGHPLVSAVAKGHEVVLSQTPFAYLPDAERSPRDEPSAIGRSWLVPVAMDRRLGEQRRGEHRPRYELLRAEPVRVPSGQGTLVVNAGGSGVYRLRYDGALLDDVLAGLDRLDPLERFKLVADTWACALAGLAPLEQFLSLTRRLDGEKDPSVWTMVAGALGLFDFAVADADRGVLEGFVQSLLGPELERAGWEARPDDDSEAARRRAVLIGALGTFGGDAQVRERAREVFDSLEAGASVPADLVSPVLRVVATTAGPEEYGLLVKHFRSPSSPQEEQRYLDSLSCVRDRALTAETCRMCLEEIRTQDAPYLVRKLLLNRVVSPQVWEFVKANFDRLFELYPENSITRMLEVSRLCQLDDGGVARLAEDAVAFVASHPLGGLQRPVDQSLERLAVNVRFVAAQRPHLRSLLLKS